MIVAIDTNLLAYAEGVNGEARQKAALALIERLDPNSTLLPVQALGELFAVLVKKARRSRKAARAALLGWGDAFPLIETSSEVFLAAMDLAVDHQFVLWDALMLAAAAEARCRLFLSEDLQAGFTWSGLTVVNPFTLPMHPLLEKTLQRPS